MITYLKIKNFRNIKELEISPSQSVNLIVGNNGEGKSSILYAIEYMLTGNLNEKISEYVRWGCEGFNLEMNFQFNGYEYHLKVKGGKVTEKELTIYAWDKDDGYVELETYKNSEATKKINADLNAHIIKYSAISEQGKASEIIFDTPANRLMRLKQILNIDKITDVVNEIKEDIREKTIQLNEIKKEVEILENKNYEFIDEFELGNIHDLEIQFKLLQQEKQIYELEKEKYNNYVNENVRYKDTLRLIEENKNLIVKLQDEINQKKSMAYKMPKNSDIQKVRDEISINEQFKIEQDNIIRNSKKIENNINKYKQDIENQQSQIDQLQVRRLSNCDITLDTLHNYQAIISNLIMELKDYEQKLELCKSGKCPTCGQDYIADSSLIKESIEATEINLLLNEQWYARDKKIYEDYQEQIKQHEIGKVQRDNALKLLNYCKEELSKCENDSNYQPDYRLIDFESVIAEYKKELKEYLEAIADNELINKVCSEIEIKIATAKQMIQNYSEIKEPERIEDPKVYDHIKYDELDKAIKIHEQKVAELDRIKKHNLKVFEESKKDNEKIKLLNSDKDNIYYIIETLNQSQKILDKDFSSFIIDKGSKFIKEQMNEFFQKAYDKYEITFSQDKHTIDFFYGDGENVAPIGMSSGFERALLGTAFRVALCSLNNIDIMSLDEIDSDSSVENSLALYETILNNINDKQFFIITHYEDTKEFLLNQPNSQLIEIENGMVKK